MIEKILFAELVQRVEDASSSPRQARIEKQFQEFLNQKEKKDGKRKGDLPLSDKGQSPEKKRQIRKERNRGYVPKTRANKVQKRNNGYYPDLWEGEMKGAKGSNEKDSSYRSFMEVLQKQAHTAHQDKNILMKHLGEQKGQEAWSQYLRENPDTAAALHEFKKRQYADIEARKRLAEIYSLDYDQSSWDPRIQEAHNEGLISASEAHARHLKNTGGANDDTIQSMMRIIKGGQERGDIGESLGWEDDYFSNSQLGGSYDPRVSPHGGDARIDEIVPGRGPSQKPLTWWQQNPFVSEDDPLNNEVRRMNPREERAAFNKAVVESRTMFPENSGDASFLNRIVTLDPGRKKGKDLHEKLNSEYNNNLSSGEQKAYGRSIFHSRSRTARKEAEFADKIKGLGEGSSFEDIQNLHNIRGEYLDHQRKTGWGSSSAENVLMSTNEAIKRSEKSFLERPRSTIEELDELISQGILPDNDSIRRGFHNIGDNQKAKEMYLKGLTKSGFEKFKKENMPDPFGRFEKPTSDIPGLSAARARGGRMRDITARLIKEHGGNPDASKIDEIGKSLKMNAQGFASSFKPKINKAGKIAVENYGAKFIGPAFALTSDQYGRGWTNSIFPGKTMKEGNFKDSPGGAAYNTIMNKLSEVAETGPRWAYEDVGTLFGGAARNSAQRRRNRREREFDYKGGMFLDPKVRSESLKRLHDLDDIAMRSPGNPGLQSHKDAWLKSAGGLASLLTGGGLHQGWEKSTDTHGTKYGYNDDSRKKLLREGGMSENDIDRFTQDLVANIKEREDLFGKAKEAGASNRFDLNQAIRKRMRDSDALSGKPWWEDPQFSKENAGWKGSFGTGKYKELAGGSDRSTRPPDDAPIGVHLMNSGRAKNEDGTDALSFSSEVERDRWDMTQANLDAVRKTFEKPQSKFKSFSKDRLDEDVGKVKSEYFKGFKPFEGKGFLSPDQQKKSIWKKFGGEKRFRKTSKVIKNLGNRKNANS